MCHASMEASAKEGATASSGSHPCLWQHWALRPLQWTVPPSKQVQGDNLNDFESLGVRYFVLEFEEENQTMKRER